MKYLQILLAFVVLSGLAGAHATPPIEYTAAVRNADGYVMANMPVKFLLEIVDNPSGGSTLYNETMSATTDESGLARLMVGEGTPGKGDYDAIDWSAPRFLSVNVDVEGSGVYRHLGTLQLMGAPLARQAHCASELAFTSPTGQVMRLTVNNLGELRWEADENTGEPNYDLTKVPQQLYFIGSFNSWTVAEAVEMTKLSPTKFTIDRHLSPGEIFKFVQVRDWNGHLDWSGSDVKIGEPVALKEWGNTPAFSGAEGDYTITVDFYRFTMLIQRK